MKTDLRIKAKNIRKTLKISEISSILIEKIRLNPLYINAKNIMIFYPKKYEINFLPLLSDEKNFYLPKVSKNDLLVCPYKKGDNLNKSEFGVMEPYTQNINPNILDLIIVPALMIDKQNYRLGYGGGYYDRFLNKNSAIKSICGIPKELFVENLPINEFDVPIDEIILDN